MCVLGTLYGQPVAHAQSKFALAALAVAGLVRARGSVCSSVDLCHLLV